MTSSVVTGISTYAAQRAEEQDEVRRAVDFSAVPARQQLRRNRQLDECCATNASDWRQFWLHRILFFLVSSPRTVKAKCTGRAHYLPDRWGQRPRDSTFYPKPGLGPGCKSPLELHAMLVEGLKSLNRGYPDMVDPEDQLSKVRVIFKTNLTDKATNRHSEFKPHMPPATYGTQMQTDFVLGVKGGSVEGRGGGGWLEPGENEKKDVLEVAAVEGCSLAQVAEWDVLFAFHAKHDTADS
eukprot:547203-Pleurochrysis_carterae.AAC.1